MRRLSAVVDEDILLTTNTSGLSITAIAEAVKAPERFVGMHWFNPPHIIPLIEVINGDKTDDANAQAVYDLAKELGKAPIHVKKDGSLIFRQLVQEGRLGVKAGAGIYDYSGDKADKAIKERDEKYMKVCDAIL